jgi:hypothetical protein
MTTRSAAPRVGFDVIADMICNVHQGVCLVSASAYLTGAVAAAGDKVKSLFTLSPGKQKVDKSIQSATPAAKQRATLALASLTLSAVTNDHPSLLRLSTTARGYTPDGSLGVMLLNCDETPPHATQCTSIIQPVYKQLILADIVRLIAGDEIILVIRVLDRGKNCNYVAVTSQLPVKTAFENLPFHTLWLLHPDDCTSLVNTAISERHTLVQED